MEADLIIHSVSQLLTCAANGKPKRLREMQDVGLIENGAVAIKDGKIIGVGKTDEIRQSFSTKNDFNAQNKVVCPAFVDPHTHIVFAGNRFHEFELKIKGADYLEILANGGGILSTVAQTRAATQQTLIEETRLRLDKMFQQGTLTTEIKTGYGLDTPTEFKMLEVILRLAEEHLLDIVPTFLAAHAIPPEYKENPDLYVEIICQEMLPQLKSLRDDYLVREQQGKPFFVDVFCEKNAFDLAQSKKILQTAKNLGFGIKAHVDEFTNLGCAEFAINLGATSIDHLDVTSDEEIELLANSETVGIITPTVNFNFGSTHFADARKMIDAGCVIALSTDYNPGSAPCPSQPLAAQIACRYQKLLPAEAFNAITVNSAFGLGLGTETGSLEKGKKADLLILSTRDFREITYEFGSNLIEQRIKNGVFV